MLIIFHLFICKLNDDTGIVNRLKLKEAQQQIKGRANKQTEQIEVTQIENEDHRGTERLDERQREKATERNGRGVNEREKAGDRDEIVLVLERVESDRRYISKIGIYRYGILLTDVAGGIEPIKTKGEKERGMQHLKFFRLLTTFLKLLVFQHLKSNKINYVDFVL